MYVYCVCTATSCMKKIVTFTYKKAHTLSNFCLVSTAWPTLDQYLLCLALHKMQDA